MATLIKDISELKQYVSVNQNLKFASIEPYIKQAERKYIQTVIGDTLYDDYCTTVPTGIELKAFKLFCEASSNLAWFLYLPLANVQVTESGISVTEGTNFKAAEWWQIRDLRRSFLEAGFNAIDEALKIMESDEASFSPWELSEGYTIFKELFVKRAETFNRWYNINNSRRTFLALNPYLLEAHHQYFTGKLNEDTRTAINSASTSSQKEVLELLQASQVNYAVVKAITSGAFDMTLNGLQPKLSELPNTKLNVLESEQIERITKERLTAGEEYYKKAVEVIVANPADFPDYTTATTATFVNPKNTKSIVSL